MVMSQDEQDRRIEELETRVTKLENIIDRMRDATMGIRVNSIPISQKRIDDSWSSNK
tara:strand:+ start:11981 stop:12151 length:171 start_codon:yes stop_codon:yes gene_type:complete